MTLERTLQQLADESAPLTYSSLAQLSDLGSEEVERFTQVWQGLSLSRRTKVIARLVELAEENAELDFNAVFKACLEDPDEEVRERAVNGLWEFEDRSIVPCFIQLLQSDDAPRVRAAAATGLGKFAKLAQEGKLLQRDADRIRDALLEVLQETREPWEVRRRALEAVAPFNSPRIKEYIRWAYASNNLELQCSALFAMGRTGEPAWLGILLKELRSPSPALRYEAANALAELQEEEAVPHLIHLLQDDDLQVALAAVRALGEIGGPLARRALRRCLQAEEEALQEAAREALETMEAMEDPLSFRYGV